MHTKLWITIPSPLLLGLIALGQLLIFLRIRLPIIQEGE